MTEPQFFKPENNENAEEFIKCLPLGVQTSFTMMAPAIATAELLRVRPMIGDSLFERAATYYASHEAEDATLKQLVALLQMTVVRLACWDSFDEIAVMMTDAGISDNQGEKRVYRYQADALKNTLQRQGYEYLNKVLEFCTEKVSELPEFEQSQYYTTRQNSLIHSMADFEKHISIGGDFCVFAKLREWIERTEEMELEFRIGVGLKTALLEHGTDNKYRPIIRSGTLVNVGGGSVPESHTNGAGVDGGERGEPTGWQRDEWCQQGTGGHLHPAPPRGSRTLHWPSGDLLQKARRHPKSRR